MKNATDIDALVLSLQKLEDVLPSILDEKEYEQIVGNYKELLSDLLKSNDEEEQASISLELIGIVANYPKANTYFQNIRRSFNFVQGVFYNLSLISRELSIDDKITNQFIDLANTNLELQRFVIISSKDINHAKSIKFRNYRFEFGEFAELVSGVILTIKDIVGETNYFYVAAGLLIIMNSLYNAMAEEIHEQEAKVFWGVIQTQNENQSAEITAVLENANQEREKIGLEKLEIEQVKRSLKKLENIGCIEEDNNNPNIWKVKEKVYIKK